MFKKLVFLRSMGRAYFAFRVRGLFARHRISLDRHISAFSGKGLEIGGPSPIFMTGGLFPAYEVATTVDNITFSSETRWEGNVKTGRNFLFHPTKDAGTQFVLEGAGLTLLHDSSYDFVLSCHMLEHAANPLRALLEWTRILKPGGHLLLVLPHRDGSFDHRRPVTTLAHLIDDFEKARGEDDSTHLPEILELHDLRRDPLQESAADFRGWVQANHANRGAHHHVFDMKLALDTINWIGLQIVGVQAAMPYHIFVLASRVSMDTVLSNEQFLSPNAQHFRDSPFRSDRQHARDSLSRGFSPSQAR